MNDLELLMPAGDPEKLQYAFAYGADAVYAGVPLFSLRARENGFNAKNIGAAIEYAHARAKRIYLTMNIYTHNSRVKRFLDYFCELQDLEPDGFIMSDVGMIHQALKLRPQAIIHLSTQANATNWAAVKFWQDLGVKRVVLSRELSISEIAEIHQRVPEMELEAFVHGSICIAYSGRCLISNYLNHRDANEGTCTNSCRWEYSLGVKRESLKVYEESLPTEGDYQPLGLQYYVTEKKRGEERFELDEDEHGTYMMNSKDLCAIELLGELRDAGVISFKVEGRAKGLYYLAAVARAYRRAIDDLQSGRAFDPQNLAEVVSTANRTLMTGFLLKRPEEYGQNYTDGASRSLTHEYCGQVLEIKPEENLAYIAVKNKIQLGDVLQWISPEQTVSEPVRIIEPRFANDRSCIRGGNEGWINCPPGTSKFSLVRRPLAQSNCVATDGEATYSQACS